MTDKQNVPLSDPQNDKHGEQKDGPQNHAPQDPKEADAKKFTTAPRDVRNQEPKNSPEPQRSQVAAINPPSVTIGRRDREQI